MTTPDLGDEFTELVDATIPRVDLVDKAANGTRFLIAKNQGGLISPDLVRGLVAKAEPEQPPAAPAEMVTMTGSPAAIAKLIHQAAIAKAKYDADDLKRMAANGEAMDDESYPIADHADLDRAIRAVGRGGDEHNAIRRHIIRRAKALGAESEIPDTWNVDGSLKGAVAKELSMDEDILDPTTALAEPEMDAPGVPTDPGSPAWEAIDAATACKWTAILGRAKVAIELLAEREMLEAATADPDDADNAFELQDAACAIDYAISVLAPFAVAEQIEAELADQMAAVGKALGSFDPTSLDTIEGLTAVAKAGRTLSAANEAAIRDAVESLQKVLASLPAAPVEKTANEESNMPEPTLSEDVTRESGQEPAMGVQEPEPKPVAGVPVTDVTKADAEKTPMVAVYDKKGNLVGIVDPSEITPISGAEPEEDTTSGDVSESDAAPEAPDLEPAPAAEVGTPADAVPDNEDDVAKSTTHTPSDEVLKSIVEAQVAAALADFKATQEQAVAKQADDRAQLADTVETLKARVEALEEQPAMPKVFTTGAAPRDLRGLDAGTPAASDIAKAAQLKKSLMASTDAGEQRDIARQMQEQARAVFDRLQPRG